MTTSKTGIYPNNPDPQHNVLNENDIESRLIQKLQDLKYQHRPDITIVVDMLLTGFDSKYQNTLYVDKNLKHHGLIQAFSRTNRVLNATKPYGNILDFRQQQDAVDAAIALFSGEKSGEEARKIWLVDKAPMVIQKLETAMQKLDDFMKSQGDGEQLSDLMAPLDLGWRARTLAELVLMADLHPLLTKCADGRDISGLSAYEQ